MPKYMLGERLAVNQAELLAQDIAHDLSQQPVIEGDKLTNRLAAITEKTGIAVKPELVLRKAAEHLQGEAELVVTTAGEKRVILNAKSREALEELKNIRRG